MISGCPEGNQSDSEKRKESCGLCCCNAQWDWPAGCHVRSIRAVSFCTIFLFLLFLWPSEESVLSCSVCEKTAVRAPGPGKGRARVSLLSWLAAGCSHGCFSDNPSPNSQETAVSFALKSLCTMHLDVHLFHPCQRKAGIYLLVVLLQCRSPGVTFRC